MQGERTDIKTAIESCPNVWEFASKHVDLFIRYHNGVRDYYSLKPAEFRTEPVIEWWYGPTGTGKSHAAHAMYPNAWVSGKNLHWFDGYRGQEVAIIDDFRKEMCDFAFFLKLLDKYRLLVEVKGGSVDWRPLVIIVTCPRLPIDEFVYHHTDGHTTAYEDIG